MTLGMYTLHFVWLKLVPTKNKIFTVICFNFIELTV